MKRLLILSIILFSHCAFSQMAKEGIASLKINGKKQFYCIKGEGQPAMVFLSGMGVPMQDMNILQDRISQITRTFAYDRPGIGRSEVSESDRSIPVICAELKELLEKTYFTQSFILLGHSRGALVARYFASKYPQKVKGLILIDPALPEIKSKQRALRTPEENAKADSAFYVNFTIEPTIPQTVKNELKYYPKGDSAVMDTITLSKKIPITIIASVKPGDDKYNQEDLNIKTARLKNFLIEAPQAKLILTEKSGHFIYEDEPTLVTNEIASMIKAMRMKGKK